MIKVGIIGFGTVGAGVVRILIEKASELEAKLGFPIVIKRIADLDIKRDRGIAVSADILTTRAEDILDDPSIDIVVELIGGMNPAKDFILRAIEKGKHVVTANKALLALEGEDIFYAAEKKGAEVGFEASVAGGIPIIKAIKEGLPANRINSIYGIINGTSNYILTRMTNEGMEFPDALMEAQRLGYAEADPTLDIEGIDSAHKLTILSAIAFGIPLSYNEIYREGIKGLSSLDIGFALEFGYKIKLLAIAKRSNSEVELRIHPTMLPLNYLIAQVDGVYNAIYIDGDSVGSTLFYGRGAGDMPTGSAVVSDIIDIGRNITSGSIRRIPPMGTSKRMPLKIRAMDDVYSRYYFRFSALDKPGVLSKISGVLGANNISIASVIQKGRKQGEAVPLVMMTHDALERDVRHALKEIDKLPVVADKTVYIRVEGGEGNATG